MTKGRGRLPGSRCKPYVPRSLGSVYALLLSSFVGTERSEVERRREGKEERRDRAERGKRWARGEGRSLGSAVSSLSLLVTYVPSHGHSITSRRGMREEGRVTPRHSHVVRCRNEGRVEV